MNGSPLGSAPTRATTASSPKSSSASAYTNGLEIDWIVNGGRVAGGVRVALVAFEDDPEQVAVGARELGDVVGERTRRGGGGALMQDALQHGGDRVAHWPSTVSNTFPWR